MGIGLFVASSALKNAHIIVPNNATFVTLGNMQDPAVLLTLLGLFITSILLAKQVKRRLANRHGVHYNCSNGFRFN